MNNQQPTALETAQLLVHVASRLMRDLHQHLSHHCEGPRITMPQMRVLRMAEQGQPTLSDVANTLRVTRPTATRLVDGLVQRGWVERAPDPKDRRRVRLHITPAGQAILDRVQEAIHALMAERLAQLSAEDRATLHAGLQALNELLTQYRPSTDSDRG